MRGWILAAALAGVMGAAMAQGATPEPPIIVTEGVKGDTILLVMVNDAYELRNDLPLANPVNWREMPVMFMGNVSNSRNPANRYIVNPMVYRQGNPYFPYYQVQGELLPPVPPTTP